MRASLSTLALAAAVALATATAAAAATFANLAPGQLADLDEQVPVNVVFVGFEPADVNEATFLAQLPQQYKPVVRSRLPYGVTDLLGIDYTYDYDVTYASSAFENAFFAALAGLATPAPRTLY